MDTTAARRQMVDQQIRTWDVLDAHVLAALAAIPREAFVPAAYRDVACADASIPIGLGQTMLAPKMHGRILQALELEPTDAVLEIGTGTGYLSACLARLAARTKSIDIHPSLVELARANLANFAPTPARVELEVRDAFSADPLGEFDAIAVTGSMPRYDARFERSLAVGGRLFAVVGSAPVMEAMRVRRFGPSEWVRETLFETVIEPLIGAPAAARFVF
ncbi:MAG TPA: protein-L-isoaspartate O-methyltransferase [Steroidobacteraceae bacterium]|nr:protein-L-isoaspartate O-methyltransferase [Steroidobacteraceae bacterium]